FKVLPGVGEELFSLVNSDPRFNGDMTHISIRRLDAEVLLPPTGQRREWITCRTGFVNDDRSRRSFLRSDLVFVSPAAVIGHRSALELLLVELVRIYGVGDRRVVDEHDDRLAFDVHAFKIVPAVFGSDDAVTNEDHVRILDPGLRREPRRARQIILTGETYLLAADGE